MMASALSCKAARNHNFHRDPGKTLQFYKESYRLYQHSDNEKELPFVCANIADAYIQLNDIPNAARCYRRALFLVDSLKQPEHSNITLYMGLAQIYLTLNDFETAKHYYDETERFFDLMRIALRRNDPAYLAEPISRRAGAKDEATYSRLMDTHNWYLPIQ